MRRLWHDSGPSGVGPRATPHPHAPRANGATPSGKPIFVARQPIFNRDSRVVAYELLFRNGRDNRFTGADVELASAVNIEQSTAAFGLNALVGDKIAFVNLTRGALLHEYWRMLPPTRTVIELLETVPPDRDVIAACMKLKTEGYRLALDDFTHAPAVEPLLALADMVKVDFRAAGARFDARLIARLRNGGIHLLAEKVETREEHREAIGAGYDLFQGYYYCRPEIVESRDLPPSMVLQLRFLSEVSREDASFERLEELFRQDASLTMRLLRYLNSAAFGWRHEIGSLRHALALMGLEPLRKWAMMIGMLSLGSGRPRELLVTSLSRARFAEELGPPSGLGDHALDLFLSGMLSVADAMVGRPLREILSGLALSGAVRSALEGGDHPVGEVLRIVTAYERGDWEALEAARAGLPVDEQVLGEAYARSLAWAEAVATV